MSQVMGLEAAFSSVGSIPGDFILDASWATCYSRFSPKFLPCSSVNHSITAAYSSITTPCGVRQSSPNVQHIIISSGFQLRVSSLIRRLAGYS
jgi:hypothetical protein